MRCNDVKVYPSIIPAAIRGRVNKNIPPAELRLAARRQLPRLTADLRDHLLEFGRMLRVAVLGR